MGQPATPLHSGNISAVCFLPAFSQVNAVQQFFILMPTLCPLPALKNVKRQELTVFPAIFHFL
jgi:hypothetical protein